MSAPKDFQHIPLLWVFDMKMDLSQRAQLVPGGHRTADIQGDNYSGVIKQDSICLTFLLADLNGLDLLMADVSNAYWCATTMEKVCITCGIKFGTKLKGQKGIMRKS